MTRERAIEIIRQYESNSEHYEACEMAIEALEQEPCEDVCERFEQSIDIVTDIVEFRFSDGTVKRAKRGLYMRDIEESLRKMLIDQMANEKKQEPCEDAISRQAILKAISTWDKFGCDADTKLVPYKDHYVPYIHYDDVINCIKDFPSVTPQPKMGRWIDVDGIWFKCSECDAHRKMMPAYKEYYCPNCGRKMQEEEE